MVYAKLEFPSKAIILITKDREIKLNTQAPGKKIPIVISDYTSKVIKSSIFSYFVCVQSATTMSSINSNSSKISVNEYVIVDVVTLQRLKLGNFDKEEGE